MDSSGLTAYQKKNDHWEVAVDGRLLLQREGARKLRDHVEDLGSAEKAKDVLRRAVVSKLKQGYWLKGVPPRKQPGMVPTEAELVAADAKMQAGDRLGELIMLQGKLLTLEGPAWFEIWERQREVLRALKSKGEAVQAQRDAAGKLVAVDARIAREGDRLELVELLEASAGAPLAKLKINSPLGLGPVFGALAARPWTALESLDVACEAREPIDLGPALASCPSLQALRLHAASFRLGSAPLPITALTVRPMRFLFGPAVESLKAEIFPKLTTLSLELTEPDEVLPWLLSGKHFPALRTLRLKLSFSDAARRLMPYVDRKSALLRRLERFDVLGTYDYAVLGEMRWLGELLAPVAHVGIVVARTGLQFARLAALVPGLERVPDEEL